MSSWYSSKFCNFKMTKLELTRLCKHFTAAFHSCGISWFVPLKLLMSSHSGWILWQWLSHSFNLLTWERWLLVWGHCGLVIRTINPEPSNILSHLSVNPSSNRFNLEKGGRVYCDLLVWQNMWRNFGRERGFFYVVI